MRFVDVNVFIYAVLKPRRKLNEREQRIKDSAKKIFERINRGEEVVTTVLHLSEVANVLEDAVNLSFSVSFIRDILLKDNINVEDVSQEDYLRSVMLAEERKVSLNDALAYIVMKRKGIEEIYTFDKHFGNLDVKLIEE